MISGCQLANNAFLNNAFFLPFCIPGPVIALLLLRQTKSGYPFTGEAAARARSLLRVTALQYLMFTFVLPEITWPIGLALALQQIIFYQYWMPPASCSNQKQGTPQTRRCSCCQWLDNLLSKICRLQQTPITSDEEPMP